MDTPSLADFWSQNPNVDRPVLNAEWMAGPRVTFRDMNEGTGLMERVEEPLGSTSSRGAPGGKSGVMTFGKYRGKSFSEVKEQDPNYWDWVIENIGGFRAKVIKAGFVL